MTPPIPPNAEAMPKEMVLVMARLIPDTAALVSLSRIARIARPWRLLMRFDTNQKQIPATMAKRIYFHNRDSSLLDSGPSPKKDPRSGMVCSA